MFWQTMLRLSYPGAKEALEYIETRIDIQSDQAEIENMYKQREIAMKQSEITSNDMAKEREAMAAQNQANAKMMATLKSNE